MNINGNWIKLFSKFINWEWYKNKNTKIVFIHCLLRANWKDAKFEGVEIKRGSFATSLQTLMSELDMSKQEIRTALKHLISTHEITQEQHTKFTVITINNYELYQQVNTDNNTRATQEQHTCNTGTTPIEEYKNIEYIYSVLYNSACACAREGNFCHLGSNEKTELCFNCMKKNKCPHPESQDFKLKHPNETFEQYCNNKIEEIKELNNQVDDTDIDLSVLDYEFWNEERL